ncbi:hypothetical protein JCM21714_16 [Gracilibacillus boraciitolerans JCM 21714]|uniref:Uncharacterized protein n=1 Tax=Gracilibacillus boraciitolerans JCM 21714 TaxID=1298598 RepID=W4VCD6_9BACI|nr:hypothetical protein [Gracilibacillus boraciitolerans]GAE91080.1 hypothetical protein JCM21714_16 [Gracilibacillus boraciitolerans JCM 21714]
MNDNMLLAKLSSLLEDENPFVSELILETVKEVELRAISVDAHAKKIERILDMKLQRVGGDEEE